MTIHDIEAGLPWGFHDADMYGYSVDLEGRTAAFLLDVPLDEHQTTTRRGTLLVRGLAFLAVSPPHNVASPDASLWIDSWQGQHEKDETPLPPIPDGCFLHSLYLREPGSYVHIAAREAEFQWTGEAVTDEDGEPGVYFPGEEIPLTKTK